ncbi:MAG: MFS transporter [Sphingobium sp.]
MSYPTIVYYSIGLFMAPLTDEFGWNRTQISLGASISSLILVPISPFVGAAIDRWGVRRLALPGVMLTATAMSSFALANGSPEQWAMLWAVFAICTAFLKATVWTAAVSSRFTASRSMALAVVLCGASISAVLVPPLTRWLIADFGWRTAYVALAVGWGLPVFVMCLLFLFDVHDDHRRSSKTSARRAAPTLCGLSTREALRSLAIFRIGLATLITLLLTASLVVHQVPLLIDAGFTRTDAAYLASLSGIASVAGSLISGWLMDRFEAGVVGVITNIAAAAALVLLLEPFRTPGLIVFAMIVIGYSGGTKLQLCGYLTSVYGGMRNYGKIFGVMGSIIAVTSAIGPMLGGLIYDRTGSYSLLIILAIPGSLLSAALLFRLGPYPVWAMRKTALPAGDIETR